MSKRFNAYFDGDYFGQISARDSINAEEFFLSELIKSNPALHPDYIVAFIEIESIN